MSIESVMSSSPASGSFPVSQLFTKLFFQVAKILELQHSKEQASFNFMAAVTICREFGAQENKLSQCFHCFPLYLPWSDGTGCNDLSFMNVQLKPNFSLSTFTFIKRVFSSSPLSSIRVVSSAYLRLVIFLLAILIPGVLPPDQCFSWCTLHIS